MRKNIVSLILSVFLIMSFTLGTPAFATRSAGRSVSDATITTKVKAELAKDVTFRTLKSVQVDTDNGIVTLTGRVHNMSEKMEAAKLASNVKGVAKVNNMLSVIPED